MRPLRKTEKWLNDRHSGNQQAFYVIVRNPTAFVYHGEVRRTKSGHCEPKSSHIPNSPSPLLGEGRGEGDNITPRGNLGYIKGSKP